MAKALVAIWGESKLLSPNPKGNYVGIAELMEFGFMRVELNFPTGVKVPDKVPCIITVDCDDTSAEMRAGKYPLITVHKWDMVRDLYDYCI